MSRGTTEAARKIDFARLKQLGFFQKNDCFKSNNIQWTNNAGEATGNVDIDVDTGKQPYIQFTYKTKDNWQDERGWRSYKYKFPLEGIVCRYGGHKWFVRCQLLKNGDFCGRRARVLYMAGDYFGCRRCADLTYESCNQGGRYKGLLSIPDLEEQEMKVGRRYYRGKPTRKYRRLLKMEEQFETGFLTSILRLNKSWSCGEHEV